MQCVGQGRRYMIRFSSKLGKAGIPRHRHRHGSARILADTSDAQFPEVIPMASSTTRRHSRDDPREDVGEEVRVGVGVGIVECQLKAVSDL